jgi:hypothetical protein
LHPIDGIINLEEGLYGKLISSVPSENIKKMKINKENIIHIYNMIYELSISYDLQLVITTNMADYLFTYMGDMDDVKIVKLTN